MTHFKHDRWLIHNDQAFEKSPDKDKIAVVIRCNDLNLHTLLMIHNTKNLPLKTSLEDDGTMQESDSFLDYTLFGR